MTVTIKRKESPSPQSVLDVVGLGEVVPSSSITSFKAGDKVKVTNTLLPWMTRWQAGDTGLVSRVWAAPIENGKPSPRMAVVEVQLDKPREKSHPTCMFHAWELSLVS